MLAGQETTNLHDIMQGQWSEPVEMFPSLMVAILLMLALENLLANRFYKRETLTWTPSLFYRNITARCSLSF